MKGAGEMEYYKVLNLGGECIYVSGSWFLPKHGPGKWMPIVKDLEMCESGYHLCRKKDLVEWLGPEIYLAEGRGEKLVGDNKVVFQQARLVKKLDIWNDRTARLFACDCAEHVVHLAEDKRCVTAIKVARKHANGEATDKELAAAWAAARAAAWAAARDAARAAAWAAARAAAWDAARDAARAAARDAERKWQTKRLFEYLEGKERSEG